MEDVTRSTTLHREQHRADVLSAQVAILTELNLADVAVAFGLAHSQHRQALLNIAGRWFAQRFAQQLATYDALVGDGGLALGGRWIIDQFNDGVEVHGALPPSTGPLLLVANHPGITDAAALFSSIARPDLRVLAAQRPLLQALPHTSSHIISLINDAAARSMALRTALRHLRTGGAVLTFPAGKIEPDPALLPGAAASLATWSDSIDLFVRLAPPMQIVPVIVSGVCSPRALRHPLVRLRRDADVRGWLAAVLQVTTPALRGTTVQVHYGQPISTHRADGDSRAVCRAVVAEAQRLVALAARGVAR